MYIYIHIYECNNIQMLSQLVFWILFHLWKQSVRSFNFNSIQPKEDENEKTTKKNRRIAPDWSDGEWRSAFEMPGEKQKRQIPFIFYACASSVLWCGAISSNASLDFSGCPFYFVFAVFLGRPWSAYRFVRSLVLFVCVSAFLSWLLMPYDLI